MALTTIIAATVAKDISSKVCLQCQGKHWDDNQSVRQNAVRNAFPGEMLPNACVNGEGNGMFPEIKCPYKRKGCY